MKVAKCVYNKIPHQSVNKIISPSEKKQIFSVNIPKQYKSNFIEHCKFLSLFKNDGPAK